MVAGTSALDEIGVGVAADGRRYTLARDFATPLLHKTIFVVRIVFLGASVDVCLEESRMKSALDIARRSRSDGLGVSATFTPPSASSSTSMVSPVLSPTSAVSGTPDLGIPKRASKSQASPSPTSPFLPPPKSSESHAVLLLFGLLSHSRFRFSLSANSQAKPELVAI